MWRNGLAAKAVSASAMIVVAEISSWVGAALLAVGLCAATGAMLILPFHKLIVRGGRQAGVTAPLPTSTNLNDAGVAFNWLAWLLFAILTLAAFFGEMSTLYTDAGIAFVYITLGMPAFLVAWLGFVIYITMRPVPTSWLFGALVVAALMAFGYANINKPL
jgi:hypothetical protein